MKISLCILVLIGGLSLAAPLAAAPNDLDSETPAFLSWTLAELTNETRQKENLNLLAVNPRLNRAAQMKAEHMARHGYFSHTSPEGITPWHWFDTAGYAYEYAGENLAVNFKNSSAVEKAWLTSPSHRANLVSRNYTEVGTGMAKGYLNGKEVMFVAQVYANPVAAAYY